MILKNPKNTNKKKNHKMGKTKVKQKHKKYINENKNNK